MAFKPSNPLFAFLAQNGEMWPFSKAKHQAFDKRVEQATALLLDPLERHSAAVINMAAGQSWRETHYDAFAVIAREVLFFELHLASRLAVKAQAEDGETPFMEAMISMTAKRAPEVMRPRFHDEYAARERFYTQFAAFKPEDDQSYEGTLFWEFSKLILKVAEQKPEASKLQGLNVLCGDMLRGIDAGFAQLGIHGR